MLSLEDWRDTERQNWADSQPSLSSAFPKLQPITPPLSEFPTQGGIPTWEVPSRQFLFDFRKKGLNYEAGTAF